MDVESCPISMDSTTSGLVGFGAVSNVYFDGSVKAMYCFPSSLLSVMTGAVIAILVFFFSVMTGAVIRIFPCVFCGSVVTPKSK